LENLLKLQKEHPDKYIGTEDDSVSVAMIQGNPVCYNCPCNIALKYENFLLQHQSEIIRFYKLKASKEWAIATKSQSELQSLELFK
jgi:predicted DCC family thiol-disulfide oxidoreductase YuxK